MIGNPFLRLSLTTSSVAGEMVLPAEDLLSSVQQSESEQACSLSGVLALLLLLSNLEKDSLKILGIKLDDGDALDDGVPINDLRQGGLVVIDSDLTGVQQDEGVLSFGVRGDFREVYLIGILLLLLRRTCPGIVGNLKSCDIELSSCGSHRLDESSSSSSHSRSSPGVKSISKYISSSMFSCLFLSL